MTEQRVVLVTGSRRPVGDHAYNTILAALKALRPTYVIVGDANGVDATVREMCRAAGVPFEVFQADWDGLGRAAGPERNERMAQRAAELMTTGGDATCAAFPDAASRGTWDCVKRAARYGLASVVFPI